MLDHSFLLLTCQKHEDGRWSDVWGRCPPAADDSRGERDEHEEESHDEESDHCAAHIYQEKIICIFSQMLQFGYILTTIALFVDSTTGIWCLLIGLKVLFGRQQIPVESTSGASLILTETEADKCEPSFVVLAD